MKNSLVPGVKKIAVLRANQLGDFIVALPALEALKRAYPAAELVLLAKPWTKMYLENRPSPVDRVIAVPVSEGVRLEPGKKENKEELMLFFENMKKERFDIAVQLHGGGRYSNRFVQNLGSRLTVGSRTPDAPSLDRYIPYMLYQNEVFRYLEVISLIGARLADVVPHVTVMDADFDEVRNRVPELKQRYAVLHPGASDPLRRWEPRRFAEVGDALAQKGYQVAVTGIAEEKNVVEAVIAHMKERAVGICGRLTVNGLTGLLSKASLVVSNDSGPLHLAQAVGAKTIGIFWAYNTINWGPATSRGNYMALSWLTSCPSCGKKLTGSYNRQVSFPVCDHQFTLTAEVQPKEIMYYADELLDSEFIAS